METSLERNRLRGDIDCYPEYTGTLRAEIFAGQPLQTDAALRDALTRSGAWASAPLGFNNTYVLGMRKDVAARNAIAPAAVRRLAGSP